MAVKGLPDKKINYIKTSNQSITSSLEHHGTKTIVRFIGMLFETR